MRKMNGAAFMLFALVMVLIVSPPVACAPVEGTEQHEDVFGSIRSIARPYEFSIAGWEIDRLFSSSDKSSATPDDILHDRIESVIKEEGITLFPPFRFTLEQPPYLLVISPRERIEYADRYLLRQDLSIADMEQIEQSIQRLEMSALVVELGGFGATYPPIVTDDAGIKFTIDAIIEEWLHQYLAFKPLGFRYLLDSIGIRQDSQVIVINETLAGMVSSELGDIVRARYYPETMKTGVPDEAGFDFDAEMRLTRRMVDYYLSRGQVEEVERYMEQRRLLFMENGYFIRKLNQAYFAFHGIYGHDPASVSPARQDLETLRMRSPSLKAFLDQASGFTSYGDLDTALRR